MLITLDSLYSIFHPHEDHSFIHGTSFVVDQGKAETLHLFKSPDQQQHLFDANVENGHKVSCTLSARISEGPLSEQVIAWRGDLSDPKSSSAGMLVDGVKIQWTRPPTDVKIRVSENGEKFHDATSWFPGSVADHRKGLLERAVDGNGNLETGEPANENFPQSILFARPEFVKSVEVQMKSPETTGYFGIDQISIIGKRAAEFIS